MACQGPNSAQQHLILLGPLQSTLSQNRSGILTGRRPWTEISICPKLSEACESLIRTLHHRQARKQVTPEIMLIQSHHFRPPLPLLVARRNHPMRLYSRLSRPISNWRPPPSASTPIPSLPSPHLLPGPSKYQKGNPHRPPKIARPTPSGKPIANPYH